MSDFTPILNLPRPQSKNNTPQEGGGDTPSYSELLNSMNNEMKSNPPQVQSIPQVQSMPQGQSIPQGQSMPQVQSMPQGHIPQGQSMPQGQSQEAFYEYMAPRKEHTNLGNNSHSPPSDYDVAHTDVVLLLMIHVFIHLTSSQEMIRTKIPCMSTNDNNKTFIGIIINGVLVSGLWMVIRKIMIKYNKEF